MTQTLTPVRQLTLVHPLPDPEFDRLRDAVPEVRVLRTRGHEDWASAVAHADAVLLGHDEVGVDDLLGAAPGLRWLQTASAGVERHLTARLRASPVVLTNGSGIHATNIAEHLLALLLGFARQLPALHAAQQRHAWHERPVPGVFEAEGQHVVVVGLGAIGGTFARKAAALGLRVTGVRRDPGAERIPGVDRVVGFEALDDVLPQADHVVIALPLTPATRHLFDTRRLARLPRHAYLYNVGRGALVEQDALVEALRTGQLAGAGLDVTDPEPLPPTSPLWTLPRVVLTAHSAGQTPRAAHRLVDLLIDNLLRAREGRPLRNVVDRGEGY